MGLSQIYRTMEKGKSVRRTIRWDDDTVDEVIQPTRNDEVIVAKRIEENTYKAIRINKESQSRNQALQDHMRNPTRPFTKDFEGCSYQLLITSIPEFVGEKQYSVRMLQDACSWNSPRATKKRTARSPRKLQVAWDEFLRE